MSVLSELEGLMGVVPAGCEHAEARHVLRSEEVVRVLDDAVDGVETEASQGLGVRVRASGAWGFAATDDVSPDGAREALRRALALAQAQPRSPTGAVWSAGIAPVAPARGEWCSAYTRDPFAVSLDERVAHLLAATDAMRGDRRVVRREAECRIARTEVAFASTEGAACTQTTTTSGGGLRALAVDGDEAQVRSYPSSHGGQVAAAGWEHVEALELAAHAPRVAEEAVALLAAPQCPAGERTVVIGAEQLALQVHESIGHALELDRILGAEASYAGTSWVRAQDVGSLRYGSEALNVVADATLAGALGSYRWDDEGVAARRTTLVEGGVLRAALSDRTSAAALGLSESGGCGRADGFARQPIVRMTNVSLVPGAAGSLDDLLADPPGGLYLETNRSWSIDDRRLHFRFGTEVAREITAGGELGRLYRNGSYAGVTPRFWGALDVVCSQDAWAVHGLLNCGKGEPGQMMGVSHGTAPARFRGVSVGAA